MQQITALARRDKAYITDMPSVTGYLDGFDYRSQRSSDPRYVDRWRNGVKDGYKARQAVAENPLDMEAWPL